MKDLYKIHEIAKLFGLHPDTLRYYEEKGLLHPERGRTATECIPSRTSAL